MIGKILFWSGVGLWVWFSTSLPPIPPEHTGTIASICLGVALLMLPIGIAAEIVSRIKKRGARKRWRGV